MYARDVMSRPVVTVGTKSTLSEAISLLSELGFAALPVVDDLGRVVGVLSESDVLAAGAGRRGGPVEDVMTVPAEVVHPGSDVSAIAARMLTSRLRSMPVVEAGILVGIVARRDLLRALIRDDTALEAKVRALLDIYAGSRRQWSVDVTDGHAVVRGGFADSEEQHTIAALALTVEGIEHVDIDAEGATPTRYQAGSLAERLRQAADDTVG
ncbi:CBS domain-containing protein [Nocardia blacklockiae]|uniref:CBS domain-containing protein n=1 Tax=Nocardia blacklockiae TaxID=480036 RepID=UPI0018941752|nr:CBS domain-containing protein [Nocardia blacklockiae]MBF6176606.1 CBS domain-containing protein [Nocardia blacklockiae]